MKTKPRTVDKYTIISITMHLICVFIYNILDFRNLFSADCRCLFIFFGYESRAKKWKDRNPAYLRIYIVYIENNNHCLFEIIYGNLVLVLSAALTCMLDR